MSTKPDASNRPPADGNHVARVHGSVLLDQRRAYTELVGADVFAAALSTLSVDQRNEYDDVVAIGWVRCTTANAVVRAVAAQVGRKELELDAVIVRMGVERTFGPLWRVLLRFATDDQIVTRAPVLYGKAYDKGQLRARMLAKGHGECTLVGFPEVGDIDLQAIGIGVAEALRISGRSEVRHVVTRTSDGARIDVRWRV